MGKIKRKANGEDGEDQNNDNKKNRKQNKKTDFFYVTNAGA